ncbi:hypothetical protein [Nocardioides korecus]
MDSEDLDVGEDFDSGSKLVRWATDPAGRTFSVEAEVPGPAPDATFAPDGDEGVVGRFIVCRLNRLIRQVTTRAERRREGPPKPYLLVWRVSPDGADMLALEEACSSMEEGRQRVSEVVDEIRAGSFEPMGPGGT